MALGLMLLPAIAASFWTRRVNTAIFLGVVMAIVSSYTGLLVSYHTNTPSGPMVVFLCAIFCLCSVLLGKHGSFRAAVTRRNDDFILAVRQKALTEKTRLVI